MLDKSLPYHNIIMKCDKNIIENFNEIELPIGYRYKKYSSGDIEKWAEIEVSVGEFSNKEKAIEYFTKTYLPFEDQLRDRCYFILDKDNNYVATATAWYYNNGVERKAAVNWVAVVPEAQGLGLGKAIVQKILSLFKTYEPNSDVYLHTQTWSHVAIKAYLNMGFYVLKNELLSNYKNDYKESLNILEQVMTEELFLKLFETSQ